MTAAYANTGDEASTTTTAFEVSRSATPAAVKIALTWTPGVRQDRAHDGNALLGRAREDPELRRHRTRRPD